MNDTKISDEWRTSDALFNELSEKYGPFQIDLCANKENSKCKYFGYDYLNNTYKDCRATIKYAHEYNLSEALQRGDFTSAFMNPPYSNPKPFIEKAWNDSVYCKIVILIKLDPSTKMWQTFYNFGNEVDFCEKCDKTKPEPFYRKCIACGQLNSNVNMKKYRGPKPGCEVILLNKRVKFDPPIELVNSGEVWKVNNNWVQKCNNCDGWTCDKCNGKGYKKLSGPTFPSCILIFDRRGL